MMKIYFAGSIRGGRGDAALYARLVSELQKFGTVLTEHVGSEAMLKDEPKDDKYIHDRDIEWLEEADVLVAEVTQPSLGVGYEIGRAVALNKPTFCLFRPSSGKRLSAMIQGAENGTNFTVRNYQEEEGVKVIQDFFATFKKE